MVCASAPAAQALNNSKVWTVVVKSLPENSDELPARSYHRQQTRHACFTHVLARQFDRPLPNQAWVCDITCLRTHSGWLYLAAVLDLHSHKIVGWAMAPEMHAAL